MSPKSAELPEKSTPIVRSPALREAVYERIIDGLLAGRWVPGSPLNEAQLSRELDVSRTPVREALLRLHGEGLLDSALARGFTVRVLSRREAQEIYPILGALEALALRSGRVPNTTMLKRLERTARKLSTETDPLTKWNLDTEWHEQLIVSCDNRRLLTEVRKTRTSISRYEIAYMRDARSRNVCDDGHSDVVRLLSKNQIAGAADRLERHWKEGLDEVLKWLTFTIE